MPAIYQTTRQFEKIFNIDEIASAYRTKSDVFHRLHALVLRQGREVRRHAIVGTMRERRHQRVGEILKDRK